MGIAESDGQIITPEKIKSMLEEKAKDGSHVRIMVVRHQGRTHYFVNPEMNEDGTFSAYLVNSHPNHVSVKYLDQAESIEYYEA